MSTTNCTQKATEDRDLESNILHLCQSDIIISSQVSLFLTSDGEDTTASSRTSTSPPAPPEGTQSPDATTKSKCKPNASISRKSSTTSSSSSSVRLPAFEVRFAANDPDNPLNWPLWYRAITLGFASYATWVVIDYSTSYASSISGIMKEFKLTSDPMPTLGITIYLLGQASGTLIMAPLGEMYGRRPVYIVCLFVFSMMIVPAGLAQSLVTVLVARFIGAFAGAAMLSNSPATVSDITTEQHRALAFSLWSVGPMNSLVTGPLIGGFAAEYLGWRWNSWLLLIFAVLALLISLGIKETYAPSILQKRAAKLRKDTGDNRYWSKYDHDVDVVKYLRDNLSRPFVLAATEPILWFWNAYIAIIYIILYICFVSYPFIWIGLRSWTLGMAGLSFLGIGFGNILGILSEPLCGRLINSHRKDPCTGQPPPEASVSVVCIASILCPIGQLWFAWTSYPASIHWIWPILAGVPFGAGVCLVFIYASNYLAGTYGIYAASALASGSVCRSIAGGTLLLVVPAMYHKMTPQWAGTLLGLVLIVMIPIPFIFYKWGEKIRAKSPLLQKSQAEHEERQMKETDIDVTSSQLSRQATRRAAEKSAVIGGCA